MSARKLDSAAIKRQSESRYNILFFYYRPVLRLKYEPIIEDLRRDQPEVGSC